MKNLSDMPYPCTMEASNKLAFDARVSLLIWKLNQGFIIIIWMHCLQPSCKNSFVILFYFKYIVSIYNFFYIWTRLRSKCYSHSIAYKIKLYLSDWFIFKHTHTINSQSESYIKFKSFLFSSLKKKRHIFF